ncbi:MAG: endoflagellar basal body-associated protein [Spirochaetae bacterium HGW-Spirochaetae-1]|jgi:flagellar basal body-associated protein FliL|nr:MAG: endoflagellar basal body-associated protein [Spirochaetae bacterium HGW-Spirochaetae-1]
MGDDERDDIIEEEGAAPEEPAGSGATSKIVKILLYVAGGILLIVLVTGISYLVSKNVQESNYEKSQDIVAAPPPPPLNTYELPSFSKTTADTEPHFIKMQISLAYEMNVELNNELVNRKDEIQHIINILLQGKKYEDLDSVSDAVELAEEIKAHINVRLISGKIKEVYFKEFVVN